MLIQLILLVSISVSFVFSVPVVGPTCKDVFSSDMSIATCSCLQSCQESDNCCPGFEEFHADTAQFMSSKGLIQQMSILLIDNTMYKYEVTSSKRLDGVSLLVIKRCQYAKTIALPPTGEMTIQPVEDWELVGCGERPFEVIAYTNAKQFKLFEEVVQVPQEVIAGFGAIDVKSKTASEQFFARLTGNSALNTYKALATGENVCGFSAKLPKQAIGKASFDPTADRHWQLLDGMAEYALTDDVSAGTSNISPAQLGRDYDNVARSANYLVKPWNACHIRSLFINDRWADATSLDASTLLKL